MALLAADLLRIEAELAEVREAISAVLRGGQGHTVQDRQLMRAQLRDLEARETRLETKLARARRGGIRMAQAVPRG